MKVGGNESATKFFQSNGGSAALNSKDPKTKYTSNAAVKYKEELKKRAARDAKEYPEEVVINDAAEGAESGDTPAEEEDDFFSSWSRPAVKKLSPPISRTATPPVVGRTPSPFLNAQIGKDTARAASPLAKGPDAEAKPAASRITTSAALRSSTTGPRKANILGAKKVTSKLGAKKIGGGGDITIDFDEAEKKAKEEAERIEKLGYDPNEEEAPAAKAAAGKTDSAAIISPTPVSPARGGYGSSQAREKSAAEVERLGMGIGRLGFGQVGKPAAAQKKSAGGFGSVGPIKGSADGAFMPLPPSLLSTNHSLLTNRPPKQTTTKPTPAKSSAPKRPSPRTSSSARACSKQAPPPRPSRACKASRAPRPSPPTPTLAGPRPTTGPAAAAAAAGRARTTATWRAPPRTLCAALASPLRTTWRT